MPQPTLANLMSVNNPGLRVASLGSGSSGNAMVVQSASTTILLDCGFTLKEITARLLKLGLTPADIDTVLITHEHGDHVRGIGPLSRKHNTRIYLTHGTYRRLRDNRLHDYVLFPAHTTFTIGDIVVDPFPTPHDAAESCQFVFGCGGVSFAAATDLGVCTPHVMQKLQNVDGLLLECNYDVDMLRTGPYPPSLQARIRSNFGHLGNDQAGGMLAELDHPRLQQVLLGHLSEKNNTPDAVRTTIAGALHDGTKRLVVLEQHACSEWIHFKPRDGIQHKVADEQREAADTTATPEPA